MLLQRAGYPGGKKSGREKFEQRVVQLINNYFDGILVHADPEIITLKRDLQPAGRYPYPSALHRFCYHIRAEPQGTCSRETASEKNWSIAEPTNLIVASIGGGNVGSELLYAAIRAFNILESSISTHLQIFCGPYCDEKNLSDSSKTEARRISPLNVSPTISLHGWQQPICPFQWPATIPA